MLTHISIGNKYILSSNWDFATKTMWTTVLNICKSRLQSVDEWNYQSSGDSRISYKLTEKPNCCANATQTKKVLVFLLFLSIHVWTEERTSNFMSRIGILPWYDSSTTKNLSHIWTYSILHKTNVTEGKDGQICVKLQHKLCTHPLIVIASGLDFFQNTPVNFSPVFFRYFFHTKLSQKRHSLINSLLSQ